jgi:hypothetical protein
MPNAHEGYVSWEKAETIRKMVSSNVPTSRHHGAPKHGDALLAAIASARLTSSMLSPCASYDLQITESGQLFGPGGNTTPESVLIHLGHPTK